MTVMHQDSMKKNNVSQVIHKFDKQRKFFSLMCFLYISFLFNRIKNNETM